MPPHALTTRPATLERGKRPPKCRPRSTPGAIAKGGPLARRCLMQEMGNDEGFGGRPMEPEASVRRRGDLPRGEPYRAQGCAARAKPAITRTTAVQLRKTPRSRKTARKVLQ